MHKLGHSVKNVRFFNCSFYTNMRHVLFYNYSRLPNDCVLDMTRGNPSLSKERN